MKLYDFQEQYLSDLPTSCIMGADTGTGKTIMALAHAKSHDATLPVLVLAPASKVRTGDWEAEAEAFGYPLSGLTVKSYESATRTKSVERQVLGKERRFWWQDYLAEHEQFILIADEVHKAKNSQSLAGKGVYALATSPNCQQFIGLSATPLPNGWQDVGNYGKIFGWWKHKTEFYSRHVTLFQIPGQHWSKISGYKETDRLESLWHSIAKPLRKEDALDLPRFRYQVVHIPKPKLYDTVRKTRIYNARELDNAPKLVNALRRTLINDRQKWLVDFLDGAEGHTVIFYNYVEEREAILSAVPSGVTIYRQDGEIHATPGKSEWGNMPDRSVTVAQYKAGGVGIELTYGDKLIYISPTYSYADFAQSVGRVYRAGQTKPVTAYLLHTKQTIDSDIWACVRRKRSFDIELWVKDTIDNLDEL